MFFGDGLFKFNAAPSKIVPASFYVFNVVMIMTAIINLVVGGDEKKVNLSG